MPYIVFFMFRGFIKPAATPAHSFDPARFLLLYIDTFEYLSSFLPAAAGAVAARLNRLLLFFLSLLLFLFVFCFDQPAADRRN